MASLSWRSLGQHSLYLKSTFTADSYDIWVTDLCRLWHEQLNRRQTIRRASENGLQIDLEDPNNLRTILNHLSSSVESGDVEATKPREGQDLELDATIRLPKPLPEAGWVFRPNLCSAEEFREQVTTPLFGMIHQNEQSEADLILRIKDKDHAIERLLDNIDKAGVDLSSVFPALAPHSNARKGLTKEEAETYVPALAPFDPLVWHEEIDGGRYYRGHGPVDVPTSTAVHDGETEDERATKHSIKSSLLAVPAQVLKKKIGGRITSPTPTPAPEVGLSGLSEPKGVLKSPLNGLEKTIGGRKPSLTLGSSSLSHQTRNPEPPIKTFKRTIGGAKSVAATNGPPNQEIDAETAALHSSVPDRSRDVLSGGSAIEEEADEVAMAAEEEKRRALRRELEQKPVPKPKKRRF